MRTEQSDYVLVAVAACFVVGVMAGAAGVSWLVAGFASALASVVVLGHALFADPPTD